MARLGLAVTAIGFAAVAYRAQIDGLGAATTHVRALATVRFNELAWLSSRAAELAEALYVQSAHDEARVWIRVSREHAGDEYRDARSSWMSVQAKLDAHAGDVAEAEALARAAVALVEATDALNRRAKTLLHIRQWSFHWQQDYRFVQPVALPRGTTISMRFTYDNSDANDDNPHHPPIGVTVGQRSTDEMGNLLLQVVPIACCA